MFADNTTDKPLISLGKKFHIHADNFGGITAWPRCSLKITSGQNLACRVAGPLAGLACSTLLQVILQTIIARYETTSITRALKSGIKNSIFPLESIVENKELSARTKRTLIMASTMILMSSIHNITYGLMPRPIKNLNGDGETAWRIILGKEAPRWVKKTTATIELVSFGLVILQEIRALLKINEQEEQALVAALRS